MTLDPLRSALLAGLVVTVGASPSWARQGGAEALKPPAAGEIPVAFLLSEGATMIDFAGPWEVFQDVMVPGRGESLRAFTLYTVAETRAPIRASGGMRIVPDFTLEDTPPPKVVVVPAQTDPSPAVLQWLRRTSEDADVVMSVCTGAFILAQAGLLDGQAATTHHSFFRPFEDSYPEVRLLRGKRFVEGKKVATAGGLTSGIDLALRVVERYFGRDVAERTARYMEYQSAGWRDASGDSNAEYANPVLPKGTTLCPVCQMEVPEGQLTHEHEGRTYHFCGETCRKRFAADPARYSDGR